MPLPAILVYLGLCLIVGIWGRERSSGFGGAFIGALFLTPLVIALILLLTQPRN
jgi:hypothetical protein